MTPYILLVDDDPGTAFFLGESLRELGPDCRVELAQSGPEALALLQAGPCDLLITDLRMPAMDGLELVRRVQATSPQTRFIVMTAYASAASQDEAGRLRVLRYMVKPFRVEELLEAAGQALHSAADRPGSGEC